MSLPIKAENSVKMSLDLQTLTQLIPIFDTSCPEQIFRFVRSCDSAFSLVSEDKKGILLVIALNKIIGQGSSDVHIRTFSDWSDLKKFLISRFSNIKTISHISLELQSMFQKPTESITDYFHRVDLCRSKIAEKLITEINDETLAGRKAFTEETALNVFINGINSEIGMMLRTREFSTLSDAASFAIQEDKIKKMNNARTSMFSRQIPNRPSTQPMRNTAPHPFRPSPQPQPFRPYSNRNSSNSQNPTNNSYNATNAGNIKICAYCKNMGHLISECRKRAYNNAQQNRPNNAITAGPSSARVNNLNFSAAASTSHSTETATESSEELITEPLQIEYLQL